MPNTARVHFRCPAIHAAELELAALGVTIEDDYGEIAYRLHRGHLRAEIGCLVAIDDTIHAFPCCGTTQRERAHLAGAAEAAAFTPHAEMLGWRHSMVNGIDRWTRWISIPADHISAEVLASAAHDPVQPDQTVQLTP